MGTRNRRGRNREARSRGRSPDYTKVVFRELDSAPISLETNAMKRSIQILVPALFATLSFASCTTGTEGVQQRQDRRTDHYQNAQDRREIRADARQERTDAWYDRHMH